MPSETRGRALETERIPYEVWCKGVMPNLDPAELARLSAQEGIHPKIRAAAGDALRMTWGRFFESFMGSTRAVVADRRAAVRMAGSAVAAHETHAEGMLTATGGHPFPPANLFDIYTMPRDIYRRGMDYLEKHQIYPDLNRIVKFMRETPPQKESDYDRYVLYAEEKARQALAVLEENYEEIRSCDAFAIKVKEDEMGELNLQHLSSNHQGYVCRCGGGGRLGEILKAPASKEDGPTRMEYINRLRLLSTLTFEQYVETLWAFDKMDSLDKVRELTENLKEFKKIEFALIFDQQEFVTVDDLSKWARVNYRLLQKIPNPLQSDKVLSLYTTIERGEPLSEEEQMALLQILQVKNGRPTNSFYIAQKVVVEYIMKASTLEGIVNWLGELNLEQLAKEQTAFAEQEYLREICPALDKAEAAAQAGQWSEKHACEAIAAVYRLFFIQKWVLREKGVKKDWVRTISHELRSGNFSVFKDLQELRRAVESQNFKAAEERVNAKMGRRTTILGDKSRLDAFKNDLRRSRDHLEDLLHNLSRNKPIWKRATTLISDGEETRFWNLTEECLKDVYDLRLGRCTKEVFFAKARRDHLPTLKRYIDEIAIAEGRISEAWVRAAQVNLDIALKSAELLLPPDMAQPYRDVFPTMNPANGESLKNLCRDMLRDLRQALQTDRAARGVRPSTQRGVFAYLEMAQTPEEMASHVVLEQLDKAINDLTKILKWWESGPADRWESGPADQGKLRTLLTIQQEEVRKLYVQLDRVAKDCDNIVQVEARNQENVDSIKGLVSESFHEATSYLGEQHHLFTREEFSDLQRAGQQTKRELVAAGAAAADEEEIGRVVIPLGPPTERLLFTLSRLIPHLACGQPWRPSREALGALEGVITSIEQNTPLLPGQGRQVFTLLREYSTYIRTLTTMDSKARVTTVLALEQLAKICWAMGEEKPEYRSVEDDNKKDNDRLVYDTGAAWRTYAEFAQRLKKVEPLLKHRNGIPLSHDELIAWVQKHGRSAEYAAERRALKSIIPHLMCREIFQDLFHIIFRERGTIEGARELSQKSERLISLYHTELERADRLAKSAAKVRTEEERAADAAEMTKHLAGIAKVQQLLEEVREESGTLYEVLAHPLALFQKGQLPEENLEQLKELVSELSKNLGAYWSATLTLMELYKNTKNFQDISAAEEVMIKERLSLLAAQLPILDIVMKVNKELKRFVVPHGALFKKEMIPLLAGVRDCMRGVAQRNFVDLSKRLMHWLLTKINVCQEPEVGCRPVSVAYFPQQGKRTVLLPTYLLADGVGCIITGKITFSQLPDQAPVLPGASAKIYFKIKNNTSGPLWVAVENIFPQGKIQPGNERCFNNFAIKAPGEGVPDTSHLDPKGDAARGATNRGGDSKEAFVFAGPQRKTYFLDPAGKLSPTCAGVTDARLEIVLDNDPMILTVGSAKPDAKRLDPGETYDYKQEYRPHIEGPNGVDGSLIALAVIPPRKSGEASESDDEVGEGQPDLTQAMIKVLPYMLVYIEGQSAN